MLIDLIKGVTSVLGVVRKHPDVIRSSTSNSMVSYSRSTRSEPLAMIDHTIIALPEMSDLMKSLTSIYAAMYSQSFSIAINHEIGDIKLLKTLEKINPNRSAMEAGIAFAGSLESFDFKLPTYKTIEKPSEAISLEKFANDSASVGSAVNDLPMAASGQKAKDAHGRPILDTQGNEVESYNVHPAAPNGKADIEAITKFNSNLTTGILFDVDIQSDNGRKVNIPITVRLLANEMNNRNILNILNAAVKNQTAKERWREWRSGGISFWNDVVLCRDITREYRKNLIKDDTGMFNEIMRRKNSNQMAGLTSMSPSISQISNILIVSKETMMQFEREANKKIADSKVRDTIFRNTQVMILCVVDRSHETVTFYYHDITVPTTATFRELKSASKSGNLDIMETIKAFQMGNGVRF